MNDTFEMAVFEMLFPAMRSSLQNGDGGQSILQCIDDDEVMQK